MVFNQAAASLTPKKNLAQNRVFVCPHKKLVFSPNTVAVLSFFAGLVDIPASHQTYCNILPIHNNEHRSPRIGRQLPHRDVPFCFFMFLRNLCFLQDHLNVLCRTVVRSISGSKPTPPNETGSTVSPRLNPRTRSVALGRATLLCTQGTVTSYDGCWGSRLAGWWNLEMIWFRCISALAT